MATPSVTLPNRKKLKPNTIKIVQETPLKYTSILTPVNAVSEKERFLKHGIAPAFVLRATPNQMEKISRKTGWAVQHDLLELATGVLERVCEKYGTGDEFIKCNYGDPIDHVRATKILTKYLQRHGIDGQISILWSDDLDCSARMMWHGPNMRYNKPEARRHTLVIKNSKENVYLREEGIVCLANHEIGTHYMRSLNDGLQPWFSDRRKFGLRSHCSRETTTTEEGLAALNTIVMANTKFLFAPALLYYAACKSSTMTFQELFDHLHRFVRCPEQRWKHVMRVKRSLVDPRGVGGTGKDQCYFQGAVHILRHIDELDLAVLYSGAICCDEVPRVRRLARTDCIKLPLFMADLEKYRRQLRHVGILNGIIPKRQAASAARPGTRAAAASPLSAADSRRLPSEGCAVARRPRTALDRLPADAVTLSPPDPSGCGGSFDGGRARSETYERVRDERANGCRQTSGETAAEKIELANDDVIDLTAPPAAVAAVVDVRSESASATQQQRMAGFAESAERDESAAEGCCYLPADASSLVHFQNLLHRVSSHISSFVYCTAMPRHPSPQPVISAEAESAAKDGGRDVGAFYVQTLPPRRGGDRDA